jgi:hypothetical protein
LAVVLFHARLPGFDGGYIGVDAFFVVSGCLITLLLRTAGEQRPKDALVGLYLRRARRISPSGCANSMQPRAQKPRRTTSIVRGRPKASAPCRNPTGVIPTSDSPPCSFATRRIRAGMLTATAYTRSSILRA